jgi:hypothetical protein
MLNDLGLLMTGTQALDLLNRLEHVKPTPALAAEIELGLLWALSQVSNVDLHPEIESGRRPEAFANNLFANKGAYIEVTAVSDDTFSDQDKMNRAANIISNYADRIRKASSKNLYFHFVTKQKVENGRYRRYRSVSLDFELTSEMEEILRNWVSNQNWPSPLSIRLASEHVDVVVQWKKHVHREGRTFSDVPPYAQDIEDNPVYKALQKKRGQLSGASEDSLKCIFLGDAGCTILRDLRPFNTNGIVTGEQIIWHFLQKSRVVIVAVFSAQRSHNIPISSPRIWKVTIFNRPDIQAKPDFSKLHELAQKIPGPRYEAYQARSLHRQGSFEPQSSGQYLGTHLESDGNMNTTIKFPARLFQELLAGRITLEKFEHFSGAFSLFEGQLKFGNTLSGARLEPAGIDEDDDYVVFEFAPDPAALPLTVPHKR